MSTDYSTKISAFVQFQEGMNHSKNTIKCYSETLTGFFVDFLQSKSLEQITVDDIYAFKRFKENESIERRRKGQIGQGNGAVLKGDKLKSSTVNRHYTAIKQFLSFTGNHELAKQIKTLKVQRMFDVLEFEDIKKVFEFKTLESYYEQKTKRKDAEKIEFYSDRMKLLLDFILSTGLRLEETFKLNKSNLKIDRKIPCVEVISGKGDKYREVFLPPTWIKEYHIFCQKYVDASRGEKIFTNFNGGSLGYGTLRTYIKNLGYFIGVPRLSFHKLRHCYAILRYEKDRDIVALSKSLGHDSVSTTMLYLEKIGLRKESQVDVLVGI
jgi:site-specific recombinase XerD